ncbi:isthmin-1-like [Haliotis rubra]|uniref:isthmin-1-like n=1 Tax=Haliotis rubra TaxID=36100 RepID=UPI001EE61EAB|nr:isthmin-1-like [Haliotis rubra]
MIEKKKRVRLCKVALLIVNIALMIAFVALVFSLTWTFTVPSHVTEFNGSDVTADEQKGNITRGAQAVQPQEKETVHMLNDADIVEEKGLNEVHNNKVKHTNKRRPNKIRNRNYIKGPNRRRSRKVATRRPASNTETVLSNNKDNFISKNKKRNIFGLRKRKTKTINGKETEVETISINESGGDVLSEGNKFRLGFSYNGNREPSKRGSRSPWSKWNSCSTDCGLGQQERVRSCGDNCQEIESKPCLTQPCEGSEMTDKWAYFEMFDLTETEVTSESGDACERWMKCSNKSIQHYLANIAKLPSCPCFYPLSIAIDNNIFDSDQQKNFAWKDASGPVERNEVYRPGAKFCIRSTLPAHSVTLAAQHCCYDGQLRLITRGRDAGTPNLVSPQLSRELHKKVDLLPWILCKGDWTRYNRVVQPNNHRQCMANPCVGETQRQIDLARSY